MEGIEWRAQLFDELKGRPGAVLRILDALSAVVPGANRRARAERVGEAVAESMPINDRETQMVAHRLAFDDFVSLIMFEGQWVFGFGPRVRDFGDIGKGGWHKIVWF